MARLIDADALMKSAREFRFVVKEFDSPFDAVRYQGRKFKEMVEKAPTIVAVPVVHCKDCKRWQRHAKVDRRADDGEAEKAAL